MSPKWSSSAIFAAPNTETGHSNLAATVVIKGYSDVLYPDAILCRLVSNPTSRSTDFVLPFRKERREEMYRHLANQHGVEDPKHFVLQRDSGFATLSPPPRTGTRDLPVEVNPAMFEQVLNASLATRQAVRDSIDAKHRSLRSTTTGSSQVDPTALTPSVSYAPHQYSRLPVPQGSMYQRSDPPIAMDTSSLPGSSSRSSYIHYSVGDATAPASYGSTESTGSGELLTSPSTSSTFPPSPISIPGKWAVLDESGGYVYITPAQFEEYYRRL